jgi:UDP-glucuronate 4-epimerase
LVDRGDCVTVLDNFDDAYDPAWKLANLEGLEINLIEGDVRDRSAVEEALCGVDAVVHLAALAGVRESLVNPAEYASVNIGGTVTLLEALRARPNIPFVFASSSSVYGDRTTGPFGEDDLLDFPASPYAGSKRAAELMCNAAHLSWAQPVTILRFFTVYGPRQRPTMAISKFIRMAQSGETIPVYGNGSSQRDYTYVDDVVAAVQAALEQPQKFTVFNVGGGSPIRLDALVAAVGEATGAEIRTEMLEEQPGDVVLTWADSTRIQQQLGWKASVGIVEGLRRTVAALGED